jgi:hypothetical protein
VAPPLQGPYDVARRSLCRRSEDSVVSIHQLKVTLDTITPAIWRRVHVRSETTLAELHEVLQDAMGWENYHIHAFEVGWDRYGDGEGRAETAVTVGGVLPEQGGRMIYTYDFGDWWHHIIDVEKIHRPHPGTTYPRCSAGRRACPPDDAGGAYGYADMLKALRARKGARYREIKEWLNGPYDPEAFDLAAINEALAAHSVSRTVDSSTRSVLIPSPRGPV